MSGPLERKPYTKSHGATELDRYVCIPVATFPDGSLRFLTILQNVKDAVTGNIVPRFGLLGCAKPCSARTDITSIRDDIIAEFTKRIPSFIPSAILADVAIRMSASSDAKMFATFVQIEYTHMQQFATFNCTTMTDKLGRMRQCLIFQTVSEIIDCLTLNAKCLTFIQEWQHEQGFDTTAITEEQRAATASHIRNYRLEPTMHADARCLAMFLSQLIDVVDCDVGDYYNMMVKYEDTFDKSSTIAATVALVEPICNAYLSGESGKWFVEHVICDHIKRIGRYTTKFVAVEQNAELTASLKTAREAYLAGCSHKFTVPPATFTPEALTNCIGFRKSIKPS